MPNGVDDPLLGSLVEEAGSSAVARDREHNQVRSLGKKLSATRRKCLPFEPHDQDVRRFSACRRQELSASRAVRRHVEHADPFKGGSDEATQHRRDTHD